MPLQQILPTWLALNGANFTSPTALTDLRTGQPFAAGGLNVGDYFDVTESEAAQVSNAANGLLHAGRYRFVNVDSGATAANVKVGTIGYLRSGTFVQRVLLLTAGASQAAGTYTIAATGGNGTGASVSVVIGTGGTVTSVNLISGGYGYTSAPTFTIPSSVGGTQGTIGVQMNLALNNVTSYDQAVTTTQRPVVFLNSITPGNYGFIQELGVATVLGNATIGSGAAAGNFVESTTAGTVNAPSGTTSATTATIGIAWDTPVASALFKVTLIAPAFQD